MNTPHTIQGKENIKNNHWTKSLQRDKIIEKISKTYFKKGERNSPDTEFKKGYTPWSKGKTSKDNPSIRSKEKINTWKGGITPEMKMLRNSSMYKIWREAVFLRDNFTCQECGKLGGFLEAHHIKQFVLFPELRFKINNGITYCSECHEKIDKYRFRGCLKN